jgi:sec-independent protein translocase protein TatA
MNNVLLAFLGWPEIVAILVIVLILFGAKKLPELAKGLGQGIKEFKKASNDVQRDLHRAMEEEPEAPRRTPPPTRDPGVSGSSEESKA